MIDEVMKVGSQGEKSPSFVTCKVNKIITRAELRKGKIIQRVIFDNKVHEVEFDAYYEGGMYHLHADLGDDRSWIYK